MHDVVVVGAGPAGLYAALRLAQRGLDVLVLEEHHAVGEPVHCTGVLAREAFAEFDLPTDVVLNNLTNARFFSPAGYSVAYQTRGVEAVVIDRRLFDKRLAASAEVSGATIRRGTRVAAIRAEGDGVQLELAAGQGAVRGRATILACGGRYSLHRKLGISLPSLFLHTAQRELPARHVHDVEIHFGSEIAPKGFAWAVPVWRDDRAYVRVGVMCDHQAPGYFHRMVDRIRVHWEIAADDSRRPHQKILPLATVSRTFADRLLVIGDAAGLVKPTTGGGIYYSLVSAATAADVLAESLVRDTLGSDALSEYERRWRNRLSEEIAAQRSLRLLTQRMSDDDIEKLFELARTDGVMPIVRRTASFNRHRELILTLFKHPPARQVLFRHLVG